MGKQRLPLLEARNDERDRHVGDRCEQHLGKTVASVAQSPRRCIIYGPLSDVLIRPSVRPSVLCPKSK